MKRGESTRSRRRHWTRMHLCAWTGRVITSRAGSAISQGRSLFSIEKARLAVG